MSDIEQLGIELTAELETFLEELRNSPDIKKWLDDPRFSSLYESHEISIREGFAEVVERYTVSAVEAEHLEEDYRNAVIITTKETLKQYLEHFKQLLKKSADIMARAFDATATK